MTFYESQRWHSGEKRGFRLNVHRVAAAAAFASAEHFQSENALYPQGRSSLYDRDTAGLPFADVPPQAQAVIVSLFYQLGAPSGYPKTWKYLCAGDWAQAARELQTGFKRYANRRADEGRLLAEVV